MVANAGRATSWLPQSISAACRIIIAPTTTRAEAIANCGMDANTSAKNRPDSMRTPTVAATSPVFPPSSIPAADSMYVVVVLVPTSAPTTVAAASDMKASSEFISSSFSSTYPAWRPTEYSVPAVSKMSTNRKVIMIRRNPPRPYSRLLAYAPSAVNASTTPVSRDNAPMAAPSVSVGMPTNSNSLSGASATPRPATPA